METPNADPKAYGSPFAKALAAAVIAGGLLLIAATVADGRWSGGRAPYPYVHRDVALIQFLCAIPLSLSLAVLAMRRLRADVTAALAGLALGIALLALLDSTTAELSKAIAGQPFLAIVVRAAAALFFVAAVASAVGVLAGRRMKSLFPTAVAAIILVALPWLHMAARSRHDSARLGEYLEAGRYGEAHGVAKDLVALDPGRKWRGRPLPIVADEIGVTVQALESQVAEQLPANATLAQRVNRARFLAMLGRTDEAIEVLDSVPSRGAIPSIESLRGTIYETRQEWEKGLEAYGHAQEGWRDRPPSPEQHAELVRATKGMGYCRRKLGRYAEAEATYLEMLELAPTAESHFLVAQFYEDTQQTAKAREHARKAMALAPDRYDDVGRRLINKLSVYHFGCLGVYDVEKKHASGSPP